MALLLPPHTPREEPPPDRSQLPPPQTWPGHSVCNTITGTAPAGSCSTGKGPGKVSWHPVTCQLWGPPGPAHTWAGHTARLWVPPDVSSLAHTAGLESTAATDPDTHTRGQSYTRCGLPIAATQDYRQKTRRDHRSAVDTGHRPMPHSLTQQSVLTTLCVLGVVAPGTCRRWEGTGLTQAIWALSAIPAGVQGWEHRALASRCQADPILLSPQFQPLLPKRRPPPN